VALARYFKVGVFDTSTPLATGATAAASTPVPILYGTTTAAVDCNISAIRVGALGAAAFPSNASFAASINIVTSGTTPAGGNAAVARQLSGVALAAATTFLTAGGTSAAAITATTISTFLWTQEIPFTAGANWGEWFTPGFEINIPAATKFAVEITESSAGSATTFFAEIEFTE
jgi:hypothetical protein